MGNCRACIDECGMEGEKKCDSYYRQISAFHIKNLFENKINMEGSLKSGNLYGSGCLKKASAEDFKKGTVVKVCCMGSGMF